jgi:hypothetical protein
MLSMTFTSFSQIATKTDSIVPLKVPIAKLVIKDILRGDGAIQQLEETEKVLELTNQKLVLKENVISVLTSKVTNLDYIIKQKDEQFKLERNKSEDLIKEIKQVRRTTFLYKVGSFIGVITTTLFLLK